MTDPADTQGARTRRRILDEAVPLFAELGFAGTSVRRVGQAAGVNVATLAYHFQDKEGLYRACIEHLYADLDGANLMANATNEEPLLAVSRAAWAFAKDHRTHIRLLHRHLLDRGSHHAAFHDRWMEPLMGSAEPFFVALRPDFDDTRRRLLIFSVLHLLVRFVLESPDDLAAFLQTEPENLDDLVVPWLAATVRSQLVA